MPGSASPQLVVACLCAAWCSSCRAYRPTFDQVATQFASARFVWIDFEDDATLVDGLEVEDFPTLLIAAEDGPRFFGPLTPQPEVLARLVRAHRAGEGGAVRVEPALTAVVDRIRARLMA